MRLKVSSETYQDEQKIRTGIQSVAAPNFVQESKVRSRWCDCLESIVDATGSLCHLPPA